MSKYTFDDDMSEEELAAHFNEVPPKKVEEKQPIDMSVEEVKEWEKQQDNSTDIYKVSARVKNIARDGGRASLTDVGEMLCNTYTHVMKAFYDFADKIKDEQTKRDLIELIRKHEDMPGNFIAATRSNIKKRK